MSCADSKPLTREDFIELIGRANSNKYISEEHQKIIDFKTEGTFEACLSAAELEDEKYGEKLCFDHSRVVLSEEKGVTNFINASYINGFQQPKAYIATETPYSKETICKFWRMIWEHQSEIIVMLNLPVDEEEGIYYWNPVEGGTFHCEKFRIETLEVQPTFWGYKLTKLCVTYENGAELLVDHFLFTNWQSKYKLPSKCDFLKLVTRVQIRKSEVKQDSPTSWKSPMVVHSSDGGTGRAMAFCAIDISISRFLKEKKVYLYSTLLELKKDRFNSLENINYFGFCYYVLYEHFTTYTPETTSVSSLFCDESHVNFVYIY